MNSPVNGTGKGDKIMTNTYRTQGTLTEDVSDLEAAREYLRSDDMTQFVKYADAGLETVVHHIEWGLVDEGSWTVTVITHRELTAEESKALSRWISGQNSDGLGGGFEQQPFAEHCEADEYGDCDDSEFSMSSFDWQTNKCDLTLVK